MVMFVEKDATEVTAEDVLAGVSQGQTRYRDLQDALEAPPDVLDPMLMQLARDGDVSLLAVGDSLSVRAE